MSIKKIINHSITQKFIKIVDKTTNEISGQITREAALAKAREQNLDLVLLSINGDEAICIICEASRHFYQIEKSKKPNKTPKQKEFSFRYKIQKKDKETTMTKIKKILEKGDSVKISMFLNKKEQGNENVINNSKQFLQSLSLEVVDFAQTTINLDNLSIILNKKK